MNMTPTAIALNLIGCPRCRQVCRGGATQAGTACPRCGAVLHRRKPASIERTWALLIAALLMYLPANLLPIMNTRTLRGEREDTILSGVVVLWEAGSWDLALIVFVASVLIPLAKIGVFASLLWSVQARWTRGLRQRTRLFRLMEWVGPWSMLDLFVVVLLVALVQFSALAQVEPGPGALAFGAVVVLTMLAAHSFDPRLMWDAAQAENANG